MHAGSLLVGMAIGALMTLAAVRLVGRRRPERPPPAIDRRAAAAEAGHPPFMAPAPVLQAQPAAPPVPPVSPAPPAPPVLRATAPSGHAEFERPRSPGVRGAHADDPLRELLERNRRLNRDTDERLQRDRPAPSGTPARQPASAGDDLLERTRRLDEDTRRRMSR